MAIEGRKETTGSRIRYGMVGGGQGAFIGAVHRIAARIDDQFELVAGALSSSPGKAKASAKDLGLDPSRSYGTFRDAEPYALSGGQGVSGCGHPCHL
jgi:predicted dehydrogenase